LAGKFEGMVRLTVAEFPAVRIPDAGVNVQEKSDRVTILPCVPESSGKSLQPSVIGLLPKVPVAAAVTL
jgi:hypothetical protein